MMGLRKPCVGQAVGHHKRDLEKLARGLAPRLARQGAEQSSEEEGISGELSLTGEPTAGLWSGKAEGRAGAD